MNQLDLDQFPRTPSQQELFNTINTIRIKAENSVGGLRPILLTGPVGVGKTFFGHRLAKEVGIYSSFIQENLSQLLINTNLKHLTPEKVARQIKEWLSKENNPLIIIDNLEPFTSLWAMEAPKTLPGFFIALSRAVFSQFVIIIVQYPTDHIKANTITEELWPADRHFHLELSLEDKQAVALNWGVDPIRSRISSNLYELLATKWEGIE